MNTDQTSHVRDSHLFLARALCDEVNNPLMAAIGHLQLLELALIEHGTDPTIRAHANALQDQLQRLRGSAAKVLAMTRATADTLRRQTATVGELLQQARTQNEELATAPANLCCDPGTEPAHVIGDVDLLARAIARAARIATVLQQDPTPLTLKTTPTRLLVTAAIPACAIPDWRFPASGLPLIHVPGHPQLALDQFFVQVVCEAHAGAAVLRTSTAASAAVLELDLAALAN